MTCPEAHTCLRLVCGNSCAAFSLLRALRGGKSSFRCRFPLLVWSQLSTEPPLRRPLLLRLRDPGWRSHSFPGRGGSLGGRGAGLPSSLPSHRHPDAEAVLSFYWRPRLPGDKHPGQAPVSPSLGACAVLWGPTGRGEGNCEGCSDVLDARTQGSFLPWAAQGWAGPSSLPGLSPRPPGLSPQRMALPWRGTWPACALARHCASPGGSPPWELRPQPWQEGCLSVSWRAVGWRRCRSARGRGEGARGRGQAPRAQSSLSLAPCLRMRVNST